MNTRALKTAAPDGLVTGALVASGLTAALGAAGPNAELALLAAATLAVGVAILARTARLPVLIAVFALPWLQASISIFHSNWLDSDVAQYSSFGGDMQMAVALSLASVVALALGLRTGAGAPGAEIDADAIAVAKAATVSRWFRAYVVTAATTFLFGPLAALAPGLSQPLLAAYNLKWAFFFALAYACAARGQPTYPLFLGSFAFELGLGLGGFFSDFKTVFLITLIAFAAASVRVGGRSILLLGAATVGLLFFGAAWSEVKTGYRSFVSGGSNQQVVVVDYPTRMSTLASMFGALDTDGMERGFDKLLRRLSYVEFFALELDYVPTVVPFSNGAITFDAISRPFMPRILFADKSAINDTVRTQELTGRDLGAGTGTSISLGYIGEFYADFGIPGMFVAIVAMGGIYGWAFRWLTTSTSFAGPLGMGLACEILLMLAEMDNSFTKVFGGYVASLLACWILGRFVVPKYWRWMLIARGGS